MAVKKGFSLIEVSIALVVLSLIVVGMLQIFSQGSLYLKRSRERTVAYNLAKEAMERYFSPNPDPALYSAAVNNITYNVALNISDGPVEPSRLKQIDVTVSWGNDSYRLVSLKADY